jgi:hypothetical protein
MLTEGESTVHARVRMRPSQTRAIGPRYGPPGQRWILGRGLRGGSLLRVSSSEEEEELFKAKSDG